MNHGYILFHTSSAAFRAERLAPSSGLAAPRLVPTPRELSSDCGVCLRFESPPAGERAAAAARDWLERERIPYDRIAVPS